MGNKLSRRRSQQQPSSSQSQTTYRQLVPERLNTRRRQSQQQLAHTQQVPEVSLKEKYAFIPDQYETIDQVTAALRDSGLESSNLILGIDFTKSNEWTGRHSFNGRSLHEIGSIMNSYEQAISIIGRTMSPFDEDNLIPCYGFGDATTHDVNVFSFYENNRPCHGFEQVLERYKEIVPHLILAGPTSFAPVVEASMDIVEASGGQYHVLVIIADGQVTRSSDTRPEQLSPQEQKTIEAIANASRYPLSIILVGVGDGPWDMMRQFDDKLPRREFDNFQFVNFTSIMSKNLPQSAKEAAFALAALMEIPTQYKATIELKILGHQIGRVPNIVPRNPPLPTIQHDAAPSSLPDSTNFQSTASHNISSTENSPAGLSSESQSQACPVCLTNSREMAFGCGHMTCRNCSQNLSNCPLCRMPISTRLRVYSS
uniref:RING-type domain-containing protein n=1 Tax=Picea sitchensis TaxID=3332 RepID=A9NV17_PICSI|nr:unknown [Picea sitchensis]